MAKKIGIGDRLRINKPKDNIDDLVNKLHNKTPPKKTVLPKKAKPVAKVVKKEKEKEEIEVVKTSIHYPKEFYRELKVLCAQEGITLKDYIMDLIKKDLVRRKKK